MADDRLSSSCYVCKERRVTDDDNDKRTRFARCGVCQTDVCADCVRQRTLSGDIACPHCASTWSVLRLADVVGCKVIGGELFARRRGEFLAREQNATLARYRRSADGRRYLERADIAGICDYCDDGLIDIADDARCNRCRVVVCLVCLRRHEATDCDDARRRSVAKIAKIAVACPLCFCPIQKYGDGCLHMTCDRCRTHFDYETGEYLAIFSNPVIPLRIRLPHWIYDARVCNVLNVVWRVRRWLRRAAAARRASSSDETIHAQYDPHCVARGSFRNGRLTLDAFRATLVAQERRATRDRLVVDALDTCLRNVSKIFQSAVGDLQLFGDDDVNRRVMRSTLRSRVWRHSKRTFGETNRRLHRVRRVTTLRTPAINASSLRSYSNSIYFCCSSSPRQRRDKLPSIIDIGRARIAWLKSKRDFVTTFRRR